MFDRFKILIGDKVDKLENKTVLLVGLGGVGGYVFESLVRSDVGNIIVCDNDVFDITNLNRQLLSNVNNIGKLKVDEAEKRKNMINKRCNVVKIAEFITDDNVSLLFEKKIDFVIDAIDTIKTKKLIIKNCLQKNIKFISVMGTGNKMDASRLEICDVRDTSYDPIAKEIRNFVKKEKINKKVPVVYSKEFIKTGRVGSTAFVPAVAGLLASSYAVNVLIKED